MICVKKRFIYLCIFPSNGTRPSKLNGKSKDQIIWEKNMIKNIDEKDSKLPPKPEETKIKIQPEREETIQKVSLKQEEIEQKMPPEQEETKQKWRREQEVIKVRHSLKIL